MQHESNIDNSDRQERFLARLNPVYESLERFCFAMEENREGALDLIGETVLRAWENFDRLRDPDAFLSWLFTTASRVQQRRRRRGRFFGEYDEGYAAELRASSPQPDESADVTALYAALARLPHRQREAVVLFEINGLSLNEILEVQGGSISALKVRLHRGRKRLARLLGAGGDYPVEQPTGSQSDNRKDGESQCNESMMIVP